MRNQWFGDNRDLVKWSVLLQIAEEFGAERILQLAYLRRSYYSRIKIDQREYSIRPEVIGHFRNLNRILEMDCPTKSDVFDMPFDNRKDYLKSALGFIENYSGEKFILFLDPDTGLEPANPDMKHVLNSEVKAIWDKTKASDVLVLYQHTTNRGGAPWIDDKLTQLARALEIENDRIGVAKETRDNPDVVFYFLEK